MRSKIILVVLWLSLLAPGLVYAAVNTTLYIQGPEGSILVDTSLVVPESCTVVDSAGASHDFSGHKAPCVLQAAKDTGVVADFEMTDDPNWGLFLDSVNGIAGTGEPDWHFWNLWKNGVYSDVGIEGIVLAEGDAFQFTYGPWKTPIIQGGGGLLAQIPIVGGPVVLDVYPRRVNVEDAVSFLMSKQKEDGSFGSPLFTDWTAVALGAYEGKSAAVFYGVNALKEWFSKNPVPPGSVLTNFERRAMALMALSLNPYEGTGQNVIEPILMSFDGQQFGSPDLVNDDIFAALVLLKAGYETNVTPLLEAIPFILSWQRESGSFGGADLTAAAVQVLSLLPESETQEQALIAARDYLALQQESTGGFGNVYSTSWVLQAIAALNEDGNAWAIDVDKRTPEHFLALHQALDGGLLKDGSSENRIWATSYAVCAALGKSWGDILKNFEKPVSAQPVLKAPDEELNQEEQAALEAQIAMLTSEIASVESQIAAAQQLEAIGEELSYIAKEVNSLRPQIVSLHAAYLAERELRQDQGLVQEQPGQEIAQFNVVEDGTSTLAKEPVSQEKQGDKQFTAEAAFATQNFFASGTGQAALTLSVGIVLFLMLGGWKVVLSLVRRQRATA